MRQYCMCSSEVSRRTRIKEANDWGNLLLAHPEWQLRNLPETVGEKIGGMSPYDIRAYLDSTDIPFRKLCPEKCKMFCCCNCTVSCEWRCPQDVMYRIHSLCGYMIDLRNGGFEEDFQRVYDRASFPVKCICQELFSDTPRYFALKAMLTELISSRNNSKTGVQPDRIVYSPLFATETVIKSHGGERDFITRKIVDPKTGYAKILEWPLSGVCPYCMPSGTIMRSRMENRGDRRSAKWKEKFYENEY